VSEKEEVNSLTGLGLSSRQATLYLTLTRYSDSTARDLHKVTTIARQDIYQVLCELEELGLVERILAKPLRFKATSTSNAVSILSRRQESKNSELRNKALMLFSHPEKREKRDTESNEPFFELRNVYRNDPHVKTAINNAKVKIRLLDKNMHWPVFYSFIDEWTCALEKGVKIEVVIEFAKKGKKPKFVDALKHANFQIRCAESLAAGALLIFDDKELAIWEGAKLREVADSVQLKALWSNHHGLIDLAINYFELAWITSSPSEEPT